MRYATLICCLLTLAGCSSLAPTENRDAAIQALKDTETAWLNDTATKDVEKSAQYYADDATVLTAGTAPIAGKDQIRAALKSMAADPNFVHQFTATKVEVARAGDLGYTRGTYSITLTDPKTKQPFTETGKYVTIFRKGADGKWLAIEDISTPDAPPAVPSH